MVSEFAQSVYDVVKLIPEGKLTTYKQISIKLNKKGSSQAIGQALKNNPFAPIVPCHRVVSSDGSIGGYFGVKYSNQKVSMLKQEGIDIDEMTMKVTNLDSHLFKFN